MHKCPSCNKFSAIYDFDEKNFLCECGYVEKVKPEIRNCYECGRAFNFYTDFDPSGCKKCGKSFVD